LKYQLYIVNENLGYYPVLNCTPPTEDIDSLRELLEIVKKLRPGYGVNYGTFIGRHDDDGLYREDAKAMKDHGKSLWLNTFTTKV